MSKPVSQDDWIKLVWDCSFNSLGAIEKKTPRELLSEITTKNTLIKLMSEVIRVGHFLGVDFPENFINYNLRSSYEILDDASILKDLKKGNKPEIPNIYVIEAGETNNIRVSENKKIYDKLKEIIDN